MCASVQKQAFSLSHSHALCVCLQPSPCDSAQTQNAALRNDQVSHLPSLNHLMQDLCICGHPSVTQHVHHSIRVQKHVMVEPAHLGRGDGMNVKEGRTKKNAFEWLNTTTSEHIERPQTGAEKDRARFQTNPHLMNSDAVLKILSTGRLLLLRSSHSIHVRSLSCRPL